MNVKFLVMNVAESISHRAGQIALHTDFARGRTLTRSMIAFFLCSVSALFVLPKSEPLRADEPDKIANLAVNQQIKAWVEELSSAEYTKRRVAFKNLWDAPKEVVAEVFRQVPTHSAGESALRNWLSVLHRIDASPRSAEEIFESLNKLRAGEFASVMQLASAGKWDELLGLLAMLTPSEKALLRTVFDDESNSKIRLARSLFDDDKELIFPVLIDSLCEADAGLAVRLQWQSHGLEELAMSPTEGGESEGGAGSIKRAIIERELQHDPIGAMQKAKENNLEKLATEIAFRTQMWPALLDYVPKVDAESPNAVNLLQIAKRASVARWAGNPQAYDETKTSIIASAEKFLRTRDGNRKRNSPADSGDKQDPAAKRIDSFSSSSNSAQQDSLAMALLCTEQIELINKLYAGEDSEEAYEWFWAHGDAKRALSAIGILKLDEPSVAEWANTQLRLRLNTTDEDRRRIRLFADVGSTLHRLGMFKLADIIDKEAMRYATDGPAHKLRNHSEDSNFRRSQQENQEARWTAMLQVWIKKHRREIALKAVRTALKEKQSAGLSHTLINTLYPSDTFPTIDSFAWALYSAFLNLNHGNIDHACEDLESFAWGRIPKNWKIDWPNGGLEGLEKYLNPTTSNFGIMTQEMRERLRRSRNQLEINGEQSTTDVLEFLVELCLDWKCYDLANTKASMLVTSDTSNKILQVIEQSQHDPYIVYQERRTIEDLDYEGMTYLQLLEKIYVQQGDYQKAFCAIALRFNRFENLSELVSMSKYLNVIGDVEHAEELRRMTLVVPQGIRDTIYLMMSLSEKRMFNDAAEFANSNMYTASADGTNFFQLGVSWFYYMRQLLGEDSQHPMLSESERAKANERASLAARCLVYHCLDETTNIASSILTLGYALENDYRGQARTAIAEKNWEAADRAVHACHTMQPDQIETLLDLVPSARKVFPEASVNQWIELYASPLTEHLRNYPDDTYIGNNLSWLFANLHYRLDEARTLSKHVAELLPEDHMYLDTYAEVEFSSGNAEHAMEIIRKCITLAPREEHYQRQLRKFSKSN